MSDREPTGRDAAIFECAQLCLDAAREGPRNIGPGARAWYAARSSAFRHAASMIRALALPEKAAKGEIVTTNCPYCQKPVETRWTERGCIPSADYTLIADWIYHAACWDKQVAEHPPEKVAPQRQFQWLCETCGFWIDEAKTFHEHIGGVRPRHPDDPVREKAAPQHVTPPKPPAELPRILECVTPVGLRARADIMRERGDESCARHLELAANEIERLTAPPAATVRQAIWALREKAKAEKALGYDGSWADLAADWLAAADLPAPRGGLR